MKKNGFTLAEVLITLGIIGVVAAMTIPTLIANTRAAQLKSRYFKSYSTITQALKLMQADDISMDNADYSALSNPFYKVFMRYLSAPYDCGLGGDYGVAQGNKKEVPCYKSNSKDSAIPYKSLDGKSNFNQNYLDDGQIAMQDGSLFLFENYLGGNIFISVDLNGYNNKPNRAGYDLFTFQYIDGELLPMGDSRTAYPDVDKYCSLTSSSSLNGITCASKVKSDADYFKKLARTIK